MICKAWHTTVCIAKDKATPHKKKVTPNCSWVLRESTEQQKLPQHYAKEESIPKSQTGRIQQRSKHTKSMVRKAYPLLDSSQSSDFAVFSTTTLRHSAAWMQAVPQAEALLNRGGSRTTLLNRASLKPVDIGGVSASLHLGKDGAL